MSAPLHMDKTAAEERSRAREYVQHASLNLGQAARDIRYIHDHPDPIKKEAADQVHKKLEFQGIPIHIDRPKGFVQAPKRPGDPARVYKTDYGFIPGVKGKDGEELDVYMGPNKKAPNAFVIKQMLGGKHDEDKVMLGFKDEDAAKAMFLRHFTNPSVRDTVIGGVRKVPMDKFKSTLVQPKGLRKTSSAFLGESLVSFLMKLADVFDTELGGHSPATLDAIARKGGHANHQALLAANSRTMQTADAVGAAHPVIRQSLGKSDRQLEHEWSQRLVGEQERAAIAQSEAMLKAAPPMKPPSGAPTGAVPASQLPPQPPRPPASVVLPPMHPMAGGAGRPGGNATPGLITSAHPAPPVSSVLPKAVVPKGNLGSVQSFLHAVPKLRKIGAVNESAFLQELERMFSTGEADHELFAKMAFTQSQYGSTGGFVDFNQTSGAPPFRQPDMTKKVTAKLAADPAGQLHSSQHRGARVRLKAPGRSVAQQMKPKGFGVPLDGATQGGQ